MLKIQVAKVETSESPSSRKHQTIPEEPATADDLVDRPALLKQLSEASIADTRGAETIRYWVEEAGVGAF